MAFVRVFSDAMVSTLLNKRTPSVSANAAACRNADIVQLEPSQCGAVLCFSHLRWDFVYQRPQHLLSRCAREGRAVFYWEEPITIESASPYLASVMRGGVEVLRPMLPGGLDRVGADAAQRELLEDFVARHGLEDVIAWYYTPMALAFTRELEPAVTVYDCMDELTAFQGAPSQLREYEVELFSRADVVFTGGRSLYESKVMQHPHVQLFPSSIDKEHFEQARTAASDPEDQGSIPHPRVGFFGVLDERLDRDLLQQVAALRPEMQFVMLGPVAKIRSEDLPAAPNLHYLGQKSYAELPAYLAGWEAAILPFALNASTKFISPTKTPEYLAAGRPVVSTPIRDVEREYGDQGLVAIAGDASAFAAALDLAVQPPSRAWHEAVDAKLAENSWDRTWNRMRSSIEQALRERERSLLKSA
jgi:glycosyltransferase involved in cell wall biosynthesis